MLSKGEENRIRNSPRVSSIVKNKNDVDEMSLEICRRLRERFREVAEIYGEEGNIIGLFFHDLVVHFTGIIIHRQALKKYAGLAEFPWVNRDYSLQPYTVNEETFARSGKISSIGEIVKSKGLVPVAVGQSIPLGYGQQQLVAKLVKLLLPHPGWTRAFLPKCELQIDLLQDIILELCQAFSITNEHTVSENWRRYALFHTHDKQKVLSGKGALLGTRNNLHNRKISVNYLQQGKQVIGFTHGEITNHVLDEPVFGYSDKTLCTTLVDYGSYQPKIVAFPPIIRPKTVKRRSSPVISKRYRKNHSIHYKELARSKNLFIPTIYQQNYLYGPKHAYESDTYYQWHLAMEKCLPNLTIKMHPKTRFKPRFECNVDYRQLDDCLDDFDVLIFDFFATAAVLAIFSDKPVIYFDIGLRNLDPEFQQDLRQRCTVLEINFDIEWEEQIRAGLRRYASEQKTCSNIPLGRYSLCDQDDFSISSTIMDIIRPPTGFSS